MTQRHDPAWHERQAADERAWLDQWARTHLRVPEQRTVAETPRPRGAVITR